MIKIKLLVSVLLVGLFSAAYSQNTYWVDNDGAATWIEAKGTTPLSGAAATTMAEANANAQAGDVIYMRGGNYITTIKPANSGTPGNPITFQRYMDEGVVFDGISTCVNLDNKHYVVVDGIACYRTSNNWVSIKSGGTYNTIKNSIFETAFTWTGIAVTNGHHTSILNNSFLATCSRTTPYPGAPPTGQGIDDEAGGPADFIFTSGTSYDLIEGNYFGTGGFHNAVIVKTNYSVVRGNTFEGQQHHGLSVLAYVPVIGNVVEDNIFLEAGKDYLLNYCGQPRDRRPQYHDQFMTGGGRDNIIRRNVFIGGVNVQNKNLRNPSLDQRMYNNTSYKNIRNYYLNGEVDGLNSPYDGEIFMNNINAKAENFDDRPDIQADELKIGGTSSSGNFICHNNFWNTAGGGAINFASNNTCNNSNLNIDPLFANEAAIPKESDLHLQASSPMIDAGEWLTTVTSASGSGTSFQVDDALFFFDGYGIMLGDVIQLEGQTTRFRIVNIDYTTNSLFVDRSITWTQGLGVALPFSGNKPDMGAYEFVMANAGGQTPYKGTAWELPGTLEAEDYDIGGEGVAYHDLTVGNSGGKYRTDSVDIYTVADIGSGYHIGDIEAGEWMEYSVNVFNDGTYTFSTRIASAIGSGQYNISLDGNDVTGTVDVPDTGGAQIWQTVSTDNISLTIGLHVLRFEVVSGGFNLNNITVSDTEAPTIPTALAITDVTSGSISLSWTASTDNVGVVAYDIYKKGVLLTTTNTTEHTDSKLLAPGNTYTYTVVAKDAAGNASAQSDEVAGTTLQFQNITIAPIPDKFTKDAPFDVEATVTSGLPLTYEVSGPATISGKTITLEGTVGTVEVTVTQAGDATYGKTSKTTSFEVTLITGIEDELPTIKIYPIPATDWLNIEGTYSENAKVQIIDMMGKQVLFDKLSNNRVSVRNLPEGAYILNISDMGVNSKAKIIIQR